MGVEAGCGCSRGTTSSDVVDERAVDVPDDGKPGGRGRGLSEAEPQSSREN